MKYPVLLGVCMAVLASGCATKEYVHEYVQAQLAPLKDQQAKDGARLSAAEVHMERTTMQVGEVRESLKQLGAQVRAEGDAQAAINTELKGALAKLSSLISQNTEAIAVLGQSTQAALERVATAGTSSTVSATTHAAMSADVRLAMQGLDASLREGGASQLAINTELRSVLAGLDTRLSKLGAELSAIDKTSQEALARATAAGQLAAGKMLYQVVLPNDVLKFKLGGAGLSDEARTVLDAFAAKLKQENTGVYVEIQGHTDNSGADVVNHRIAQERADAVRDYLHIKGGLPLHRLSTVSYGETAPLASNKTLEGRKQNRRVVLVVLQ